MRSFRCAYCGAEVETDAAEDARAIAEAQRAWGCSDPAGDPSMARVCHDCYTRIMQWARELLLGQASNN